MINTYKNTNGFTLILAALGAIISIPASPEAYDFSDSIIGIIIAIILIPFLIERKSLYSRIVFSVVSGLVLLLIFGVAVDYYFKGSTLNIAHFIYWAFGSSTIFFVSPYAEKHYNKKI